MKLLEDALNDIPVEIKNLLNNYNNDIEAFKIIKNYLENIQDNKQKVDFLENILILAKGFYYEEGRWLQEKYNIEVLLDDKNYDELEHIFNSLNNNDIEIGLKTKIIKGEFPIFKHTRLPGVSQHKTHKQIDVENYFNNKNINENKKVWSEKLDGSSLYLIYNEEGNLIKGVTRGDGVFGNDITINIHEINDIPKKIDMSLYEDNIKFVEVRGEVLMLKENLIKINDFLKKENKKVYKNTRNGIPGILMSPHSKNMKYLHFKAYQEILEDNNGNIIENNIIDKFTNLKKLNFKTPKFGIINKTEDLFKVYDNYILKERKKLPYDIDGLVITVNDSKERKKLGYTNKKENGSVALKFPADAVMTKVIDIDFQLGNNSGNLTPVVKVEPVEVEGVIVSNISLANESLFNSTALSKGDNVYIRRSGDVIPQIVKNEKFDYFYKEIEIFLKKIFEKSEFITDKLKNKFIDEYSETIPLRFELMTSINKLLLSQDFDNKTGFIKKFNETILLPDLQKEVSKTNNPKDVKNNIYNSFKGVIENEILKITNSNLDTTKDHKNKIFKDNIPFIKNCPSCGSVLNSNGIISKCINDNCDGRKKGKIINFISKTGAKGLSKSGIEFLYDNKLINNIEDLFTLTKNDFILSVDVNSKPVYYKGWGEKKINKTLEIINSLKTLEPHILLGSLGIENYGRSSFKKLLNVYNFDDIINNKITEEQYKKVEGFDKVSNLIKELKNKENLIKDLLKYITLKEIKKETISKDSIKIYFTGSPKGIKINDIIVNKKDELFSELSKINPKIVQSKKFSKSGCDILLYGGVSTTKIDKANKMGINSISIDDFIKNNFTINNNNKLLYDEISI